MKGIKCVFLVELSESNELYQEAAVPQPGQVAVGIQVCDIRSEMKQTRARLSLPWPVSHFSCPYEEEERCWPGRLVFVCSDPACCGTEVRTRLDWSL